MSEHEKLKLLQIGELIQKRAETLNIPPEEIEIIYFHKVKKWAVQSKHSEKFKDLLNN